MYLCTCVFLQVAESAEIPAGFSVPTITFHFHKCTTAIKKKKKGAEEKQAGDDFQAKLLFPDTHLYPKSFDGRQSQRRGSPLLPCSDPPHLLFSLSFYFRKYH